MDNLNFGSGNQILGQGSPLEIVAKQMGISLPPQQSPSSAGFNPALQPSVQGGVPMAPPPTGQPMPLAPMEGPQGLGMGSSEASLIIQVLGDRLKNISSTEKQAMKPPTPPAPEPMASPAPMGAPAMPPEPQLGGF